MKYKISYLIVLLGLLWQTALAQDCFWQQGARYKMHIDVDVEKYQYQGKQQLTYFNNSPDTLYRVFYHLYYNAFQPGSMMDVRSTTIVDPDPRVGDRISHLTKKEIGYQKINSLTQEGTPLDYSVEGTILEVDLVKPILPGTSTVFDMDFTAQIPLQIRRTGRTNKEGIELSMTQWYPKMAEYDHQGWHANPYIGREYHGVWGDFEVNITIDRDYILGGTGYLQNPQEVGYGYAAGDKVIEKPMSDDSKLTWKFYAPDVHDFMWAADPDYQHDRLVRSDGTVLHFLHQTEGEYAENWAKLPKIIDRAFDYINTHYGPYPYKQYSFIQGGDGGMEYPMGTLITGKRSLTSLVGVSIHELMHNWFQGVLATNESLYPWMDEGFTSYATTEVMNWLRYEGLLTGQASVNPHEKGYSRFSAFIMQGQEEAISTHADHYVTNSAYGRAAYSKGSIFLRQSAYIVGQDAFDRGMLRYYDTWKFRHPTPNDFIRIMEKESGMELDWYKEYMINTTHHIDYKVANVTRQGRKESVVELNKIGAFPMPLDVRVRLTDGSQEWYTIPLRIMRGAKTCCDNGITYQLAEDWPWTNPTYELIIPHAVSKIDAIEIDPHYRMLDVDRKNNVWKKP